MCGRLAVWLHADKCGCGYKLLSINVSFGKCYCCELLLLITVAVDARCCVVVIRYTGSCSICYKLYKMLR